MIAPGWHRLQGLMFWNLWKGWLRIIKKKYSEIERKIMLLCWYIYVFFFSGERVYSFHQILMKALSTQSCFPLACLWITSPWPYHCSTGPLESTVPSKWSCWTIMKKHRRWGESVFRNWCSDEALSLSCSQTLPSKKAGRPLVFHMPPAWMLTSMLIAAWSPSINNCWCVC